MGTVGKGRRIKRLFKQINQDLAQKYCTQKKSAMANSGETSADEIKLCTPQSYLYIAMYNNCYAICSYIHASRDWQLTVTMIVFLVTYYRMRSQTLF